MGASHPLQTKCSIEAMTALFAPIFPKKIQKIKSESNTGKDFRCNRWRLGWIENHKGNDSYFITLNCIRLQLAIQPCLAVSKDFPRLV